MRVLALLVVLVAAAAAQHKCGQVYKNEMPPAPSPVAAAQALVANQTGQAMVGGQQAYDGTWPWTVAIYLKDWFGYHDFRAAGAILSDQWVVTTYSALDHGAKDNSNYVRVGSTDHTNGGTTIQVDAIYHLGDENDSDHYDDIALIHLSSPIQWSDNVQPICLPASDSEETAPGKTAWFNSWGHVDTSGVGKDAKYLMQSKEKFVDNNVCLNNYQATDKFCTAGTQTCKDDMGGNLMQKKGDSWYLYGLSATDNGDYNGDCRPETIFTRVSNFCWWFSQEAGIQCIN